MPILKGSNKKASELERNMEHLMKMKLYVGIPDSGAARKPVARGKTPPSNALLGFYNEFGAPERHLPARPFLYPGFDSVKGEIADQLAYAAAAVLAGAPLKTAEKAMAAAGLIGQNAVRQKITDGPFAPLSPRTIQARAARGRTSAKQYVRLQQQGVPTDVLNDPAVGLAKPLIDTGQLRNVVTYIIEK